MKLVVEQLLEYDHRDLIAGATRADIDELQTPASEDSENQMTEIRASPQTFYTSQATLGSPSTAFPFESLETDHAGDRTYKDFRKAFQMFLAVHFGKQFCIKKSTLR